MTKLVRPLHQLGHRALDQDLGPRVDGARRFVEDEDLADRQEAARASGAASGPARARRVVVEDGVVAVRQGPHEVVHVGGLGRSHDLGLRPFAPSSGTMFSRLVPWNSHVSSRTMQNSAARVVRVM